MHMRTWENVYFKNHLIHSVGQFRLGLMLRRSPHRILSEIARQGVEKCVTMIVRYVLI